MMPQRGGVDVASLAKGGGKVQKRRGQTKKGERVGGDVDV